MNPKLIFISIIWLHSIGHAEAPQQLPVEVNKWYTFWFDAPRNEYSGTALSKNSGLHVKVLELRGNWAKVDHYFSQEVAVYAALIDSADGDDDKVFQQYLRRTGKTKDEFLKEVRSSPLDQRHRRTMWLNLSRLEAITKFELPPPKAEQDAAVQEPARGESKPK